MDTNKPNALSSYTILAAALPPCPSFPTPATHYMYIRKDTPTTASSDSGRSIFVSNIPVDATETALRAFFKQISGALVERVDFEEDLAAAQAAAQGILVKGQEWQGQEVAQEGQTQGRKRKRGSETDEVPSIALPETRSFKICKSGENAVVVFVDKATADAVLRECRTLARKKKSLSWTAVEELGLNRYKEHHRLAYPPRAELQQSVNGYLAQYTILEAARNKKLKQLRSEPDEDGFVTVTRGGRAGPARIEEAQAAAEKLKEREKKRVGATFYRFQTREDAKRRERELREKFEDDARKLKDIRQRKGVIRPE